MEMCAGCGAEAPEHPIIGIGRDSGDMTGSDNDLIVYPVCRACHEDPAHRTLRPLKVHFHERAKAGSALMAARVMDTMSKQGLPLGFSL